MNNNFILQNATKLTKSQMKSVKGGFALTGTCGFLTPDGFAYYGVSKEFALEMVAGGGRWCCDSCKEATWLKN